MYRPCGSRIGTAQAAVCMAYCMVLHAWPLPHHTAYMCAGTHTIPKPFSFCRSTPLTLAAGMALAAFKRLGFWVSLSCLAWLCCVGECGEQHSCRLALSDHGHHCALAWLQVSSALCRLCRTATATAAHQARTCPSAGPWKPAPHQAC